MIARPFGGKSSSIFSHVADRPLPDFAREIGASSWAQLCLKYILSNPAVTVVIPGTDDPEHIVDNMGAARGELPDSEMKRRIEQIFDELGVVGGRRASRHQTQSPVGARVRRHRVPPGAPSGASGRQVSNVVYVRWITRSRSRSLSVGRTP